MSSLPVSPSASVSDSSPANLVAGALAHLGTHMATGCPRAAYLAAMLLEKVANDPAADDHLRRHAGELAEILDRDTEHESAPRDMPSARPITTREGLNHGM